MVKRCCYGNCNTDSRYSDRVVNVVFFPFPKPNRNIEKCLRWIKLCGRPNQQLNVDKLSYTGTAKHFYVCSKHFVEGKPTRDSPDPLPASPFDCQTTVRRTPQHQPPRNSATPETIRNNTGAKANHAIMVHQVQTDHKNRTSSRVRKEANMLLEKMRALGLRPVLFLASPFYSWRDQNHWVSEVFAPLCHLSETSVECLERMKALFDLIIKGWIPKETPAAASTRSPPCPPKTPAAASTRSPPCPPKTPAAASTRPPSCPPKTPAAASTRPPSCPPKTPAAASTRPPPCPPKTPAAASTRPPPCPPKTPAAASTRPPPCPPKTPAAASTRPPPCPPKTPAAASTRPPPCPPKTPAAASTRPPPCPPKMPAGASSNGLEQEVLQHVGGRQAPSPRPAQEETRTDEKKSPSASDAGMWTIGELRAVLRHPVTGDNAETRRYIQRTILEYEEGVSLLQGEDSRQRKLLTAAWSPRVRLNRAEVLQHTACREALSPRPAQEETLTPGTQVKEEEEEEPWTPGLQVKEEQAELGISPGGDGGPETKEEEVLQDPSSPGSVKTEDALPSPANPTEAGLPTRDSEADIKPEPQPLSCGSDNYTTTETEAAIGALCPDMDSKMRIGLRDNRPPRELERVAKTRLRTRTRVHAGERPYSCPDCGKAFATKGGANRHIRGIHHGDRPFRCELCASSFTFESGLNRHLRVHTGERPYTCSFCGLSFTQSGNLTTHIDVHHRTTSVKCKMKA